MKRWAIRAALLMTAVALCPGSRGDDQPPPFDWKPVDQILGVTGAFKDDVNAYTIPRGDLDVSVDGMAVPAAAGVASHLYFFHCSCGKTRVVGQFVCADYEANDVMDAIRPGSLIHVASVGSMFVSDRPHVTVIRFQGEGDATALAKALRAGLDCTGDARTSTTQPAK